MMTYQIFGLLCFAYLLVRLFYQILAKRATRQRLFRRIIATETDVLLGGGNEHL